MVRLPRMRARALAACALVLTLAFAGVALAAALTFPPLTGRVVDDAGHGLTVGNTPPVAAIPEIEELNIGHSVVARALFVGLADAVRELRVAMDDARRAS